MVSTWCMSCIISICLIISISRKNSIILNISLSGGAWSLVAPLAGAAASDKMRAKQMPNFIGSLFYAALLLWLPINSSSSKSSKISMAVKKSKCSATGSTSAISSS